MASSITSEDDLLQIAIKKFEEIFKNPATTAASAPGRVNLIGEHTDYNNGFVFPMALPMVTIIVGRVNDSDTCNVSTTNPVADLPTTVSFPIPSKKPLHPGSPKWANYVKGVVANFKGQVPGFDAVVVSSVPLGGGLSSSASLEVATYTFLEALTNQKTDAVEKALACQKAEHDFAGMPCGIMDQFISVMGRRGHAMLLDCRSMEASLIKIDDPRYLILITNSNVHHELSSSEYPVRRAQCEKAAEILQKSSLRDAAEEDLQVLEKSGVDPVIIKRARHVIGEIKRAMDGVEALKKGDYNTFGQLMNASHKSLKEDYEVSCEELDALAAAAAEVEGVLGSRMTGGGFGGCTVTLVKKEAINDTIDHIKKRYKGEASFYVVTASTGCQPIPLS